MKAVVCSREPIENYHLTCSCQLSILVTFSSLFQVYRPQLYYFFFQSHSSYFQQHQAALFSEMF